MFTGPLNIFLDYFSVAIVFFFALGTGTAVINRTVSAFAGFVLTMLLAVTAMALLSNCASAPPPKPAPPPLTSEQMCRTLQSAFCDRLERCLQVPVMHCLKETAGSCDGVTGVTEDETARCYKAMVKDKCTADIVPAACQGIADADAPNAPQPKVHDL